MLSESHDSTPTSCQSMLSCLRQRALVQAEAHLGTMLYPENCMPIVFVIAADWKLRTAVRAELRELGIDALGMDSLDDAGRALAGNQMPAAIVLDATAELAGNPAIQNLIERVPTILIASRTETVPLPPVAAVLYRPVRIGDIVAKVRELLARGHAA
jgi:DNA-binding response OmpR family regulator